VVDFAGDPLWIIRNLAISADLFAGLDGAMTPKKQQPDAFELFRSHFDQILNPEHPLIRLANRTDWSRFDAAFAGCYSPDMGAPGKAIRLMVGLHYLKHMFDESDESVLARWVENPYWQYFVVPE
jgi:IS5 family transposase